MGWIKKVKIDRHECRPPELPKLSGNLKYGEGSIWRCRGCKKHYRVIVPSFSSPQWDLVTDGPKNCPECGKFMRTRHGKLFTEWECWGCGHIEDKVH